MALQNTDNFLVSRAGSSHKLAWSDLQTDINASLDINDAFVTTGDPVTSVQSIVPYSAAYGIQLPVAGVNDYNISGALRFNSVSSKIELYDGSGWVTASGNTSFSSAPPATASEGDIWYDVDDGRSYVYYNDGDSSQWVEMNPSWNGGIPPEAITPDKISEGGIQWATSGDNYITGNFGVGETSPAKDIHISSANPTIRLQDSDDTYYSDINQEGNILYLDADQTSTGSGSTRFRIGGTELFRLQASGTALFTGKVQSDSTLTADVGTTLATKDYVDEAVFTDGRNDATGVQRFTAGIQLGSVGSNGNGTATSDTLDDYEEGTFTPFFSPTDAGSGMVNNYAVQDGVYTKVGNLVTVRIDLALSSNNGGGTGNLTVGGLPFPASETCSFSIGYNDDWDTSWRPQFIHLDPTTYGGKIAIFRWRDSTNGVAALRATDLRSGSVLVITGSYFTDS